MKYVKLYQSIKKGTLAAKRGLPLALWPLFLLEADWNGVVDVHPGVLAAQWGFSEAEVREAIAFWEKPDLQSRNPSEKGKRIVRLDEFRDWGWQVVNFAEYRDAGPDGAARLRDRLKKRRKRASARESVPGDGPGDMLHRGLRTEEALPTAVVASDSVGADLLAQSAHAPSYPVELELNDGSLYGVTQLAIDRWKLAYPNVDVLTELRRMAVWCHANRSRRKTRMGIERSVVAWLGRAQDRGGFATPGVRQSVRARADEEYFGLRAGAAK